MALDCAVCWGAREEESVAFVVPIPKKEAAEEEVSGYNCERVVVRVGEQCSSERADGAERLKARRRRFQGPIFDIVSGSGEAVEVDTGRTGTAVSRRDREEASSSAERERMTSEEEFMAMMMRMKEVEGRRGGR